MPRALSMHEQKQTFIKRLTRKKASQFMNYKTFPKVEPNRKSWDLEVTATVSEFL